MTHSNPPNSGSASGQSSRSASDINVHDVIGSSGMSQTRDFAGAPGVPPVISGSSERHGSSGVPAARGEPGVLLDGPNVSTLNVLLVGNDAFCQRVIKRLAEAQLVAKTSCVTDYLRALGQASHLPPDVVLGQVDGLDGRSAAVSVGLRRLSPDARLLVVAEPGKASSAIKAVESGFDDYLLEPVDASMLRAILLPASVRQPQRGFDATADAGTKKVMPVVTAATRPVFNESYAVTPEVMAEDWRDAWEANVVGMSSEKRQGDEKAKQRPTPPAKQFDTRPDTQTVAHDGSLQTRASQGVDGVSGDEHSAGAPPRGRRDSDAWSNQDFQEPSPASGPSSAGQSDESDAAAVTGGMYGDDPYDTSDAELGDIDLVDCLLTEPGQFKAMVLKLVGGRSGVADVDFTANASEVPRDHSGAWVTFRGRRLGVLHAPPPAVKTQLAPWASWLAHWLAMQQQMNALWNMANKDELTGAWNRRFFDRHLARVIALAAQKRLPVTVLVFDIDNFKTYNDRYGHPAGDEILCETVRLMASVIREHDVVARIGGDEFAVVFWDPHGPRKPDSSHPDDVRDAARRFQQAICSHHFPKLLEEAPGTLTISGGLASYPWDGVTAQSLVERADTMLLHSKTQGKNAITFGAGAARGGDPFAHES